MNRSQPPPINDPGTRIVYESEDNPVVRQRSFQVENLKTRGGLAAIFLLLFVPPDQRTKVVSAMPHALINAPVFIDQLVRSLF
jgi:hypothetical protein